MKLAIIVGTRPEIIKMAPVVKECERRGIPFTLIHSNQHYSPELDAVFFEELGLPHPAHNLHVGSGSHGNQTGNILIAIEPIFEQEKPDVVLVQGDTNTTLAAALAAHKLGIKVGHIEAGLRSYDRTMPEEGNRVVTDHLSDFLFAVTPVEAAILEREGIARGKITTVGNTIVDAVRQNVERAEEHSTILEKLSLKPKAYCLFTAHRSGNVDTKGALSEVVGLLEEIQMPVVWPIHPRAKKRLDEYGLSLPGNVTAIEPLGYLDFLHLEQHAKCIVTDSGGLQEEACILGIPCITIRENTERPETVAIGANVLVGRSREKLREALRREFPKWENPFGAGNSAKKILDIIAALCGEERTPVSVRPERITVVGMGYMGLPTALMLANAGYTVSGFDTNEGKVADLNKGAVPFTEPGLSELFERAVQSKRFSASTAIAPADIFIVAVPTPQRENSCDLSFVMSAMESIASVAVRGNLVVIESTVTPGTGNVVEDFFKKRGLSLDIVHAPERALPGNTLHEIRENDRVIGAGSDTALTRARELYASFVNGELHLTDTLTAEAVKLMENTYRDVNIALANEFSLIADERGFDVFEAIRLANRHPRVNILEPGPGVGGHCIALDPWFLVEGTHAGELIRTARTINDRMPAHVVERFYRMIGGKKKQKICILGLAYKKNVDDARETPSAHVVELLTKDGHDVRVHDPYVKGAGRGFEPDLAALSAWADAFILMTDHDAYQTFQTDKPVLDTRNILHKNASSSV